MSWKQSTVLALFVVSLVGCSSGSSVDTVGVSGTVKLDGKPAAGIEVNFLNDAFAGYGKTDSQGHYELVAGAAPGENTIYFSKVSAQGLVLSAEEEGLDAEQMKAGGADPTEFGNEQQLPAELTDPELSKVKFVVPDGGTTSADFNLSTN